MEQPAHAPPSSRQSKLLPVSLDVNVNVASVWPLGSDGAEPIVVFGAVVSTVQVRVAALESVFPAASIARLRNVWAPSEIGE